MSLLLKPDEMTLAAARRLRGEPDFQRILKWFQDALAARDAANRPLIEGVQLRMGQGASLTLAEALGYLEGKQKAGALADTREGRPQRADTRAGPSFI